MTVAAGSSEKTSSDPEKKTPSHSTDQGPDSNEAQNHSSWVTWFASRIWPGSRSTLPPPQIHLEVSTSSTSYSLSSPDPLKVSLTFTLQQPSLPMTVFVRSTVFSPDPNLFCVTGGLDFVDILSGEKFEPSYVEIHVIPDPWQNQLSYRNTDLFATLYPSVPYVVKRNVESCDTDFAPMKAGREYRLEHCASDRSLGTWWDYGRKWQVLKWNSWPFSQPRYAAMFAGDEGRDRPSPFYITCVRTCSVKVID